MTKNSRIRKVRHRGAGSSGEEEAHNGTMLPLTRTPVWGWGRWRRAAGGRSQERGREDEKVCFDEQWCNIFGNRSEASAGGDSDKWSRRS